MPVVPINTPDDVYEIYMKATKTREGSKLFCDAVRHFESCPHIFCEQIEVKDQTPVKDPFEPLISEMREKERILREFINDLGKDNSGA